jgi:hypothetical protein
MPIRDRYGISTSSARYRELRLAIFTITLWGYNPKGLS